MCTISVLVSAIVSAILVPINESPDSEEVQMSDTALESILAGRRSQPKQLIEALQDVQETFGYVSEESIRTLSQELGVPLMEVCRVAAFYKAFRLTPAGRNVITVCMGTACHVRGARLLVDQATVQLGVKPGEVTEDGQFSVERVNCLGACALGPVVMENGTYHHHMTSRKLRSVIQECCRQDEEAD